MKAKYRNAQIMLISYEGEYKQSTHSLRCCTLFWESLEEKNPGVIQRGCMWGGWFALCENQASFWVLQASEAGRKLLCAACGAGVGVTAFILMVAATDLPGRATAFE